MGTETTDAEDAAPSEAEVVGPAISPLLEMGAYETLWQEETTSFKRIADMFRAKRNALPSDFVPRDKALETASDVLARFAKAGIRDFGVRIHGAGEYPTSLRDARDPVELLYFQGWWDVVNTQRSVAVVGTRKVSDDGAKRTIRLVRQLVEHNYTVVSGLAEGVDTLAHRTAIEVGGWTIAVVGTPLNYYYPKENQDLQREIAREFLLISQVPVVRYARQDYRKNRLFFPERNKTMSALTQATIIVEAGETSGTLIQAQAAFEQGRKLFILDNCFRNPQLTWPAKFQERGAVRVRQFEDILRVLESG